MASPEEVLDEARTYRTLPNPVVLTLALDSGMVVFWNYQGDLWALASALLMNEARGCPKTGKVVKLMFVFPWGNRSLSVTLGPANRQSYDLKAAYLEANPGK